MTDDTFYGLYIFKLNLVKLLLYQMYASETPQVCKQVFHFDPFPQFKICSLYFTVDKIKINTLVTLYNKDNNFTLYNYNLLTLLNVLPNMN